MNSGTDRPVVLFVRTSNRGKSQMAEALLRRLTADAIEVHSAGTQPAYDTGMNAESVAALAEAGTDMSAGTPKPVDPDLLRRADRVVVLGTSAHLDPIDGMRTLIEVWETDEPSLRGIDGTERMALIRDDITDRVDALWKELGSPSRRPRRQLTPTTGSLSAPGADSGTIGACGTTGSNRR